MKKAGLVLVVLVLACTGAYAGLRAFDIDPSVRFGGTIWFPVHAGDPWVPDYLALAMQPRPPTASSDKVAWRTLAPGFEAGELPVRAAGREVDRILLARVDPKRFRFVVRNEPSGRNDIDGWMNVLCGAALVINGSYYAHSGLPATPVVSDGHLLGPAVYAARQGAFVSADGATTIVDLSHRDWRQALHGTRAAMVSYPLLLAPDGSSRAPKKTGWLANRSFLGQDRSGHIILGTTRGAFFSLDRLALFLKRAPLGLKTALNLDGGPVACQAIDYRGFRRTSCGTWEIEVQEGEAKMLLPRLIGKPAMPMALAVYPRGKDLGRCRPGA